MNIISNTTNLLRAVVFMLALVITPLTAMAAEVVDINRADAATMIEHWKGIGEKKAKAIVAYRKKNGNFASIDELQNVTGIGEGIIKNNRKYMSVSKGVFKPSSKSSTKTSSTSKSTDKKSTSKDSKTTKSTASKSKKDSDKSSKSSKSTSKKSSKKTDSKSKKKKSKKSKCKPNSKDKDCKKKAKKSKKKKASTT